MSEGIYHVGDSVRLKALFTSQGVATDPGDVEVDIMLPDGSIVTKEIGDLTNPQVGTWYVDYVITIEGRHRFRYRTTVPAGVEVSTFHAKDTPFD